MDSRLVEVDWLAWAKTGIANANDKNDKIALFIHLALMLENCITINI